MPVSFPKDYIGKQVHVLFYVEEEVKKNIPETVAKNKPSDFFGILTQDEGEKFNQHIQQIRNELDSCI